MSDSYSIYQAKAQFSAIMERVRRGETVTVSYRGTPVAEIRPLREEASGIARRLDRLAERRVLVRPAERRGTLTPAARRPGALRRFLDERDA